jgi:hypothetical protein
MEPSREKRYAMSKRVVVAIVAVLGVACVPGVASADGGNGASFCSESGAPFRVPGGPVLGDFSTFGNAGEIIAFFARSDDGVERPGQLVRSVCNPSG